MSLTEPELGFIDEFFGPDSRPVLRIDLNRNGQLEMWRDADLTLVYLAKIVGDLLTIISAMEQSRKQGRAQRREAHAS